MKKGMSLVLMVIVFGIALQANAGLVTFEFRGTITEVVSDPWGLAGAWGSVGDPFWGYLSYDLIWRNAVGGYIYNCDPYTEYYWYNALHDSPQAIIELSLSTPSQHQVSRGDMGLTLVRITDSPTYDSFVAGGEYHSAFYLGIWLDDITATAFSGTYLPSDLDLTDWSHSHYVDITGLPDGGYVRGDISSIHSVPEVNTAMLLTMGIFALVGLSRWRRNGFLDNRQRKKTISR